MSRIGFDCMKEMNEILCLFGEFLRLQISVLRETCSNIERWKEEEGLHLSQYGIEPRDAVFDVDFIVDWE